MALFFWANTALLLWWWRALPYVLPEGGPWLRLTAILFGWMAAVMGLTLTLGLIGQLSPVALTLVPTLGLLAWVGVERRWKRPPFPPLGEPPSHMGTVVGAVVILATFGLWFSGPGWSGTRFVFDDITYHATVPALWSQAHQIGYTPLTYQSYYTFNAELISLWFLVLVGTPAHAGLTSLLAFALIVASIAALAESMEVAPGPVMLLLASLLVSPKMMYFARTFSATGMTMVAFAVAMLAFSVHPPSRRLAVWAGLAAGAALGTKISSAGIVAVAGVWWLGRARADWRLPLLFVGAAQPLGAWWYVHNLIATGNPLFPAEMGPLEGPLEKSAQFRTSLMYFIQKNGGKWSFWEGFLRNRLNWPLAVGISGIIGLFGSVVASARRERRGLLLLVSAGLVFLMLHPLQPFSGTINRPDAPMHKMVRYGLFPVLIGLPLIGFWFRRDSILHRGVGVLGLGLWGWVLWGSLTELTSTNVVFMVLGGLVALGLMAALSRPWVGGVLVGMLLVVLTLRTPAKIEQTAQNTYSFSRGGRLHEKAWRALNKLPDGAKVAWISDLPASHGWILPNLGSRLQHRIVPVDHLGSLKTQPIHLRWRNEPSDWWQGFHNAAQDGAEVLKNLRKAGVEVAVVSRCQRSRRGQWPRVHEALLAADPSARLYRDKCAEVWRLAPTAQKE